MDAVSALPPLFVRTVEPGRVEGGILLTGDGDPHPWFTGERQCDACTPGGRSLTGFAAFPTGCDPVTALDIVSRIFEREPGPATLWFDGHRTLRDPGPVAEPVLREAGSHDGQGIPWAPVPGFEGRALGIGTASPGTIEIPRVGDTGLFVEAQGGETACLLRPGSGQRATWTVLPELGLVGAYWLYYRANAYDAMALIARRLMDGRPNGPVPVTQAVVVAHAAAMMTYLGDGYRSDADAFTARCPGDDLDVDVMRWSFLCDGADTDAYEAWNARICERMLAGTPRYAVSLKVVMDRMRTIQGILERDGSTVAGRAKEAAKAARALVARTHFGHALLTTARP